MKRVPAQRFDAELLDAPIHDRAMLVRTCQDMAVANRYFGGTRSILRRVAGWVAEMPKEHIPSVLDIGTGGADIPQAIVQWAARRGRRIQVMASDIDANIVAVAQRNVEGLPVAVMRHDALQMPLPDHSVDIVTCTLVLHHLAWEQAVALVREMVRVARHGVIINDLRRSWGGYWGSQLLAHGIFAEISQNDAPLSVLRAYTRAEARQLLAAAETGGTAYAEPVFRLSLVINKLNGVDYS